MIKFTEEKFFISDFPIEDKNSGYIPAYALSFAMANAFKKTNRAIPVITESVQEYLKDRDFDIPLELIVGQGTNFYIDSYNIFTGNFDEFSNKSEVIKELHIKVKIREGFDLKNNKFMVSPIVYFKKVNNGKNHLVIDHFVLKNYHTPTSFHNFS